MQTRGGNGRRKIDHDTSVKADTPNRFCRFGTNCMLFLGRTLDVEPDENEALCSKYAREGRLSADRRSHSVWNTLWPGATDGFSDATTKSKPGQSGVAHSRKTVWVSEPGTAAD